MSTIPPPAASQALAEIRRLSAGFLAAPHNPNTFTRLWVALAQVSRADLLAAYPDGRVPVCYEHLIALGNHAFHADRFAEAADFYTQAQNLRPDWPFAPTSLAYALATLGRHAEADALIQRVAERYAWPCGNLRLGAQFWQELQAAAAPPHPVELLFPASGRSFRWWAVIGVDSRYLQRYAPALIQSFQQHHGDEAGLHVHVVNPTDAARDQARQLAETSGGRLAISAESVELGEDHLASCDRIRERRAYFACARFLLAPQLLRDYGCPLAVLDADLTVKQQLTPLVEAAGDWDVALTRFPVSRQILWQQYFASFQVFRPTPGGAAYATLLMKYLRHFLDRDRWIWPLDQAAMYSLGEYYRHGAAAPAQSVRIAQVPPEIITDGVYFQNYVASASSAARSS